MFLCQLIPVAFLATASLAYQGLNDRAQAAGKLYFGSATDNPELTDQRYEAKLNNTSNFGQLTPTNSQKWDAIEPTRNNFTFAAGDAIVALAEANGQRMRCHNLVWHNQLPSWVSDGGFDNKTLVGIMKHHITKEVTHYKGKCYAWDVVNEALNDDGTFRESIFYNTTGPAYIPIAFAAARAADPDVKLYYNDYNIETAGAKATAAQNLVKMIRQYGVEIDGVGVQGHLIVGEVPSASTLASNLNDFVDLGVEVAYTELDIRMTTPPTVANLSQQATDYSSVISACKSVDKCVGVTIWDYTDKFSWIPSTFPGQGAALPWNKKLQRKPAYYAIHKAWGPSY